VAMYKSVFAALKVKIKRHPLTISGMRGTPAILAATTNGLAFAEMVLPDSLFAERRRGLL
jgi:hypothetical protein